VADKLAHGFLDAAVVVPPLAFSVALGLRGPGGGVIVPQSLSLGGNTVTMNRHWTGLIEKHLGLGRPNSLDKARALAAAVKTSPEKLRFAVVHNYSTHNLLLRYWLAAGGLDPDRDVTFTVVPPAQTVEALEQGHISGFCAGAPWGAVAQERNAGRTVVTSHGIWRNGPEKALAVNEAWAADNSQTLHRAQRALLRAARHCDAPVNSRSLAQMLSRQEFVGIESSVLAASLPQPDAAGDADLDPASVFFRHAATFPWLSHAYWFLEQMARWDLIRPDVDLRRVAERVYRPDLYATAARSLGLPVPLQPAKAEGHGGAWVCGAEPEAMAMLTDGFCDGRAYPPPPR
jgi:two-component system, oxyanion-binding sensor